MYSSGVEYSRSTRVARASGQMAEAAARAGRAAYASNPVRDAARVSGQAQPARAAGIAQELAKLQEIGLFENASAVKGDLPEGIEEQEPDAILTIFIENEDAQPEQEPWNPHQGLRVSAVADLISAKGQNISLALYRAVAGQLDGLLLELGGASLPLGAGGELLAGLEDGSFRMLHLNQESLTRLLDNGLAKVEFPAAKAAPSRESAEQSDTAGRPSVHDAAARSESVPQTADPKDSAGAAIAREAVATAPAAKPAPAWEMRITVPSIRIKAGGAEEWAKMHTTKRSFDKLTETWLGETRLPEHPEARVKLAELRQNWIDGLRKDDPPAFRAWLELQNPEELETQLEEAERAEAARETGEAATPNPSKILLPRGYTKSEHLQWMSRDILSYIQVADQRGSDGFQWLKTVLALLLPTGAHTEAAALLQNMNPDTVKQWRKRDENGDLTKQVAEYLSILLGGKAAGFTSASAQTLDLPAEPWAYPEETEKDWLRRKIAYEVDSEWAGNLKLWLDQVDGWSLLRCQYYVNKSANEWSTGLMEGRPAHFRYWLASPLRHSADTGWFNCATGSFPIETLPEGFGEEDYQAWIRWDVLDYL